MHWPPADSPADSFPPSTDPVGEERSAGAPAFAEPAPATAYEATSTFASPFAAASESPWPNRFIWTAAAAAAVCGGVWFAGGWEVRLDDPPAGALADGAASDVFEENWNDDDWPENVDAEAESDLSALWGEEPPPPAAADDATGAEAFDMLAASSTTGSLDDVSLTPPETPPPSEPTGALAGGDIWGDAEPAATPMMPQPSQAASEPAGGVFAATAPPMAAPSTEPSSPGSPVRSAEVPTIPSATAGTGNETKSDPFREPVDPFGEDAAASGPSVASPSPAPAVDPTVADDPFAGAVTPASAASSMSADAGVRTADAADSTARNPIEPTPADITDDLLGEIDKAIAAGEVLLAHTELSRLWWDEPDNRSVVRGRLDGTARQIYFDATSHFMTPRTVAAGETLADVAADLSLPEMYLARVNRVAPAAVAAGDELKVIRGPFGAALDLSGGDTLTLHAHGYYVRAFPSQSSEVTPGEYIVAAKAKSDGGTRILCTGPGGEMLELRSGTAPAGRPAVSLKAGDLDQIFDLLTKGSVLSVRP
ncbi:hypothetical protein [Alienimonas chondri]|uniref:LysM domain-containing protein n=1 Tax=Alienimonas chondri TaxID=2681879 RepID=A0ABX1VFA0_9PLAN|nr:hypothetical protein [Alienimonas chondri]NNJ26772.1 hypothetical protein [Alienimonas chondri]